jgi:hypothetical protein
MHLYLHQYHNICKAGGISIVEIGPDISTSGDCHFVVYEQSKFFFMARSWEAVFLRLYHPKTSVI